MTALDEWHVSGPELERYASHTIPTFARASVESHLLVCDRCRSALLVHAPAAHTRASDETWSRIADRIDVTGRPLRSSTTAVQVSISSPLLTLATLAVALGVIVSVAIAAATADPRSSLPLFVMLAPLAPVIGAVSAFRAGADPAGQLAGATPLAAGRLPFFRAVFSSGTAILAVAISSIFVPVGLEDVAVWLLPGLALTSLVVAISTRIEPSRVALVLLGGWALAVSIWSWAPDTRDAPLELSDFAAEQRPVQVALIALTVCSATIATIRRDELPAWRSR
jgi:hypothetical protein